MLFIAAAFAQVEPACEEVAAGEPPSWYVDDQHQQDFLLNFYSLSTTLSPLHAPIPDEPGHGSLGLEVSVIPPLSCDRRLALARSKTEETNKTPILPRPRATFTFPAIGPLRIYLGLAYAPPVPVFGTRNVLASGEAGVGIETPGGFQLSGRYHYTLMKTVAELVGPFDEADGEFLDFYSGSTLGVDLMAGKRFGPVIPYVSIGITDASTYFWIGDDAIVTNNASPYLGPVGALGAQVDAKHVVFAGELYAAPGRFNRSYAQLYTARLRGAVTW